MRGSRASAHAEGRGVVRRAFQHHFFFARLISSSTTTTDSRISVLDDCSEHDAARRAFSGPRTPRARRDTTDHLCGSRSYSSSVQLLSHRLVMTFGARRFARHCTGQVLSCTPTLDPSHSDRQPLFCSIPGFIWFHATAQTVASN